MILHQICKNCFSVKESGTVYLQSYDSVIAKVDLESGKLTVGKNWKYSKTTFSHLFKWMNTIPELSDTVKEIDNFRTRILGISYLMDKGIIAYDENL